MISPKSEVVVVFPFVPVIASTAPFANAYASSISPQMAIPISRMVPTIGRSVGTPGLKTKISVFFISSSGSVPVISATSERSGFFS